MPFWETTVKKSELNVFRKQLEFLAARLRGEQSQLRRDMVEAGTAVSEEAYRSDDLSRERADGEVSVALIGNEETMLAECDAALARIQAGTFGVCGACGRPIAKARLATVPYASTCIRCARG
jgi:DnaK suppressor protein